MFLSTAPPWETSPHDVVLARTDAHLLEKDGYRARLAVDAEGVFCFSHGATRT
jgi:hypothetical protein